MRIENSQPITPAAKLESTASAQLFELHAKSSISGTESKGCLATIWQGIKNVFNFLFGWIFRCCGAEKVQEEAFEPTAEFQAFYDDFVKVFYPHLDIDYFKDFETRKDLFMRVMGGDFHPVEESKVLALFQWVKDEHALFIGSEEEFKELLVDLTREYLHDSEAVSKEAAEDILAKILEKKYFFRWRVVPDDQLKDSLTALEELIEGSGLTNPVRMGGLVSHGFDVIAQELSARDNCLYTYQDVLEWYLESRGESNDKQKFIKVGGYDYISLEVLGEFKKFNYISISDKNVTHEKASNEDVEFTILVKDLEICRYVPLYFDSDEDMRLFLQAVEKLQKKA